MTTSPLVGTWQLRDDFHRMLFNIALALSSSGGIDSAFCAYQLKSAYIRQGRIALSRYPAFFRLFLCPSDENIGWMGDGCSE